MAITTCKECKNDISTTAKACPKCGAVVSKRKVWRWVVGVPVALFAALLIFGATISDADRASKGHRLLLRQIASGALEAQFKYDDKIATSDSGDFVHICGTATLSPYSDDALPLSRPEQRYIVTYKAMNSSQGMALFDGSDDPSSKMKFEVQWQRICSNAEPVEW